MLTLSMRVKTDAYAQGMHQFLVCMLSILKGMRSVHALVPVAYALCKHQFLICMLSVCISS
jgi:hypothetical protein